MDTRYPNHAPTISADASSAPILSTSPLGGTMGLLVYRLALDRVADEIRAVVRKAGVVVYSPLFHEALRQKAVAEIRATISPAIDPAHSLEDRVGVEQLTHRAEAISEATDHLAAKRAERIFAQSARAALVEPMSRATRTSIMIGTLAAATGVAVVIGYLMASSIDVYLVRNYVLNVYGSRATPTSASWALMISIGTALALLVPQALAVTASFWSRAGAASKLGFLALDLVFSGAFATVRLGERISYQSIALSLFEAALLAVCTLALVRIGAVLHQDRIRADSLSEATRMIAVAASAEATACLHLETLTADQTACLAALAERERLCRSIPMLVDLAISTVDAVYIETLGALRSEEIQAYQNSLP